MIQEHNLRTNNLICRELLDICDVYINLAISHKGGTAIFINKKLNYEVIHSNMSADSRIISMDIKICKQVLHLVNVYAPASATNSERDTFFQDELLFYLRNNLNNVILGGDWNCVTSKRDCESGNIHISKSLSNIVNQLRCRDAWIVKNNNIEYSYVRDNYGSRIDRFYVRDLANYITDIKTYHVNFSDHSGIVMTINLPNEIKRGKYYWKLNTSLLDDKIIKDRFKIEWDRIKSYISFYDTIINWWEMYAKYQIKNFFIDIGREENHKKYGMLEYLELKLNRLYDRLNKTGQMDYKEVKRIKDRINSIKTEILEGVKIRSRIQEQIEGEKISAYLIGKQSTIKSKKAMNEIKVEENIVNSVNSGTILNKKESIEWYINSYYGKLYEKEVSDNESQIWFLQFIEKKISQVDAQSLENEITEKEIYNAINNLNVNKSPGIDGIPNEFYLKYWDVIHKELSLVLKNIINGEILQGKQRRAIITLIPKDGDLKLLKSWRPISLICSDVKIIAKILAIRLKPLMPKIVSNNQYCVNERTIVECNCKLRDILYYAGKNNITGSLVNLDWEKAFDRVDWGFLMKILKKLGFPNFIMKWIMVLYTDISSSCLINGNITKEFKIERGVRQGCPLSMLIYVLFQEPLYQAIEKNRKIIPIEIPDKNIKEIGYADDTTICIKNDDGLKETFHIINKFEKASNSKINIKKTKIYGFGNWSNRINWPIQGLKVEFKYFKALGVFFSTDYDTALTKSWDEITKNVKISLGAITGRNANIYQRAILVNSLIASKIWYTSHVYPLPYEHEKDINLHIFRYIWNSYGRKPLERLERNVLYKRKEEGGIGLLNIHMKAKSILASTTIKMFLNSDETSIIKYYLALRVNNIFGLNVLPTNVSYITTTYYEYAIDVIKLCIQNKDFPNINSKKIYMILMPEIKPRVENDYPLYDWNNIWKM